MMKRNGFTMSLRLVTVLTFFLMLIGTAVGTKKLATSSQPIQLNLKRLSQAEKHNSTLAAQTFQNSARPVRTRPAFFQKVLGLTGGETFRLNLEKWRAVRDSRLFANLTAVSVLNEDGVSLSIEGYELPAITVAPELSLTASIENPEVMGSLFFKDRNFRGLGEYLEFSLSKKEGVEDGVSSLPVLLKAKWKDNTLGKTSRIEAEYAEDHFLEGVRNLLPNYLQRKYLAAGGHDDLRISSRIATTSLKLQGSLTPQRNSPVKRFFDAITSSVDFAIEPFKRDVSFVFQSTWEDTESKKKRNYHAVGARTSIFPVLKNGVALNAWYESGWLHSIRRIRGLKIRKYNFEQVGIEVQSPSMNIATINARVPTKEHADAADSKTTNDDNDDGDSTESNLPTAAVVASVVGKVKAKVTSAWGDGCIPLHHHHSLGSVSTFRGFFRPEDSSYNHAPALGLLKSDLYLKGTGFGTFGAFVDSAIFLDSAALIAADHDPDETAPLLPANTFGLSYRLGGLRLDCGFPVGFKAAPKLHLGFDAGD